MGYRNYIGKISKERYDKLKKIDLNYLNSFDDDTMMCYNICDENLHELGSYVNPFKDKLKQPFFKDPAVQSKISDDRDFHVIGKDFLETLIERYSGEVRENYKEMLSPFYVEGEYTYDPCDFLKSGEVNYTNGEFNRSFDFSKITQDQVNAFYRMIELTRVRALEWGVVSVFDKNRPFVYGKNRIVRSDTYEYNIFELCEIYKNFDWENSVMVYYGY